MKATNTTILSAVVLCLVPLAACGETDPDDPETAFCAVAESVCSGDTICGVAGCENAFDRTYLVAVDNYTPAGTKSPDICDDASCDLPRIVLYADASPQPINGDGERDAELFVSAGSTLALEVFTRNPTVPAISCGIDLDTDLLRRGYFACGNPSAGEVLVSVTPL